MNNLTPWPAGAANGSIFNNCKIIFYADVAHNELPAFPGSHFTQATDDLRLLWDDRTPTGLHSLPNFPSQPHSGEHVSDGKMIASSNPRPRETVQQSLPRSTRQANTQVPPVIENSRSTALRKLQKEVYNPTPNRIARRLSLYYRDNAVNALRIREKEKNEDRKRCAICLIDFEPKEEVMLTPCNHRFHEDCIVSWLESQGRCPACKFVICESVRGDPSSFNSNDIANKESSDQICEELLSTMKAMEEAFQLSNRTH